MANESLQFLNFAVPYAARFGLSDAFLRKICAICDKCFAKCSIFIIFVRLTGDRYYNLK